MNSDEDIIRSSPISDDDDMIDEQGGNGAAGGQGGQSPSSKSALEDNIRRKGKNAYYYAHAKKLDAPKWDGNEEPRLLAKEALGEGKQTHAHLHPPEPIRQFAWSDEKEKIKIYVTMAELEELDDDKIKLDWTSTSLSLFVNSPNDRHHVLHLTKLYDEIEEANYRKKKDRVTLTLKKKGASTTWFDLRKS